MSKRVGQVTASALLKPSKTKDYLPSVHPGLFIISQERPPFTLRVVEEMLTDPRVVFGLWLIKGPILQNSKFQVVTDDPELKDFLVKNITRFWRNSAARALKSVEWGFSGHEVMYRVGDDNKVHFDILRDCHPMDVRAVTKDGNLVGVEVKHIRSASGGAAIDKSEVYLGGPKAFWHVHWRHHHPWYGRARLYSAYVPWWEMWTGGGYRDIRRLFFHKYAFFGGTLYHPPGITRLKNGETVSNKDLAREMLEKLKTGGTMTLPNIPTGDGNRAWSYDPPTMNQVPAGILEYGDALRDELWEGMAIPPEVAKAEGTGAFAGRRVPQQAFYAILQELSQWLMSDFEQQVLRPLVALPENFGPNHADFEIIAFGLLQDPLEAAQGQLGDMQPPMEGGAPGPEQAMMPQGTMMSHVQGGTSVSFYVATEDKLCKWVDPSFCMAGTAAPEVASKKLAEGKIRVKASGGNVDKHAWIDPAKLHSYSQRLKKQGYLGIEQVDPLTGVSSNLAVSPNQEDHLTFPQALSNFHHPDHERSRRRVHDTVANVSGFDSHQTSNSLGDWAPPGEPPGAEQGHFVEFKDTDESGLRKTAAQLGLNHNQISVLTFAYNDEGPDSQYQVTVKSDNLAKVRDQLGSHGIHYRTLVPDDKGNTRVVMTVFGKPDAESGYDPQELHNSVYKFIEENSDNGTLVGKAKHYSGTGEFVGHWNDRSEARDRYLAILGESPESDREGDGGKGRDRIVDGSISLSHSSSESYGDFIDHEGNVELHHFSPTFTKDDETVDPQKFGHHSHSRREKMVSDVPRAFFYLNPDQKEHHFLANSQYSAKHPGHRIYNLLDDPKGYKAKNRKDNQGVLNLHELLKSVSKDKDYDGVYYRPADRHVVAMFKPTKVKRVRSSHPTGMELAGGPAPVPFLVNIARKYHEKRGIPFDPRHFSEKVKADPKNGAAIADAFEAMKHNPNDKEALASYRALADETKQQFQHLVDHGIKPVPTMEDPYKNSDEMHADLGKKQLKFLLTKSAFGNGEIPHDSHPMLQKTGTNIDGHDLTVNDMFRFVHDVFGHGVNRGQFGAHGEEQAWSNHARMYSPHARGALATETRGQNSWVNFGKHLRRPDGSYPAKGEKGWVHPKERPYAEQKVGLLPKQFHHPEGIEMAPRKSAQLKAFKHPDQVGEFRSFLEGKHPDLSAHYMSGKPLLHRFKVTHQTETGPQTVGHWIAEHKDDEHDKVHDFLSKHLGAGAHVEYDSSKKTTSGLVSNAAPDLVQHNYDHKGQALSPKGKPYIKESRLGNWEPQIEDARRNVNILNEVIKDAGMALHDDKHWRQAMSLANGKNYPVAPKQAMNYANQPEHLQNLVDTIAGGGQQSSLTQEGLDHTLKLRNLAHEGKVTPAHTALLCAWGMLSRSKSPFMQEAQFVSSFDDLMPHINKAVNGEWDDDARYEYDQWQASLVGTGRDDEGGRTTLQNMAVDNLNSHTGFGKFLYEMSLPGPDGRPLINHLHDDLWSGTPSATTPEAQQNELGTRDIRRRFMSLSTNPGIDNKVLSFISLLSGKHDCLILDRVQLRHLFHDTEKFGGEFGQLGIRNIYEEGFNNFTKGWRGLAMYELLEEALTPHIQKAYEKHGVDPKNALGRFHWDSWVRFGFQETSHHSINALLNMASGLEPEHSFQNVWSYDGVYWSPSYGVRSIRDNNGEEKAVVMDTNGKLYLKDMQTYFDGMSRLDALIKDHPHLIRGSDPAKDNLAVGYRVPVNNADRNKWWAMHDEIQNDPQLKAAVDACFAYGGQPLQDISDAWGTLLDGPAPEIPDWLAEA